jgi:hypothetical protein
MPAAGKKQQEKKKMEEPITSDGLPTAPTSTDWLDSHSADEKAQMLLDAAKDFEAYVVAEKLNKQEAAQLAYAIAKDLHDSKQPQTPRKKTKKAGSFGFSSPNSAATNDISSGVISVVIKMHGMGKRSIKPYDSDKILHSTTIIASCVMQGASMWCRSQ